MVALLCVLTKALCHEARSFEALEVGILLKIALSLILAKGFVAKLLWLL